MKKFEYEWISTHRQTIMGFSILYIMFFHSSFPLGEIRVLRIIKSFGNLGVDIFLCLSGIGIYYSLYNAEKVRKSKDKYFLFFDFYKKRLIRILPATVICLLPWYLYLYHGQKINPAIFILNITSISYWFDGVNRGWYVALTILLYLIYPLVYLLIRKCGKRKLLTLSLLNSYRCLLKYCYCNNLSIVV